VIGTARLIQALIIFSAVLGVPFLLQVYPLLPALGFDFVALGWVLFVVDSALTFVRPRLSFFVGFVLALAALAASLGEPSHYGIIQSGNVLAATTLILGDVAELLLLILTPYYFLRPTKDEWAWPGAKSQA
jgi:hypothetical protein